MDSISEWYGQKEVIAGLKVEIGTLEAENKKKAALISNNNIKMLNRLNIAFMLGLEMSDTDIVDRLGVSFGAIYAVKKLITV